MYIKAVNLQALGHGSLQTDSGALSSARNSAEITLTYLLHILAQKQFAFQANWTTTGGWSDEAKADYRDLHIYVAPLTFSFTCINSEQLWFRT